MCVSDGIGVSLSFSTQDTRDAFRFFARLKIVDTHNIILFEGNQRNAGCLFDTLFAGTLIHSCQSAFHDMCCSYIIAYGVDWFILHLWGTINEGHIIHVAIHIAYTLTHTHTQQLLLLLLRRKEGMSSKAQTNTQKE